MERRKVYQYISKEELKPFRAYKTKYTYLYFKKINGVMFMSEDNKRYRKSIIDFHPHDKVFITEVEYNQ